MPRGRNWMMSAEEERLQWSVSPRERRSESEDGRNVWIRFMINPPLPAP